MEIKELQRNWDEFGKTDPLWAILTHPTKKDRKWDQKEFFQSGEAHVALIVKQFQDLGIELPRSRCLDFGCGVGRLTQAFCREFEQVCGVDIAPSMIEQAQRYNRYGDRCRYYLNSTDDLALFDDNSFDLVYSVIVLQHMIPAYSKKYIGEFIRIIKPGGYTVFQVPSERVSVIERFMLPPSGFRAQISLAAPITSIRPGQLLTLPVQVKNVSDTSWPATFHTDGTCQIRLGNHWLDPEGQPVMFDDGRAFLPKDISPGETATVPLTITGPAEPGRYLLELDLVQEMVSWFKNQGSATLSIPVRNAFSLGQRVRRMLPRQAPAGSAPVMEVHVLPQVEILEVVQRAGGRIVDIQEDPFCGMTWKSFTYFVTKEPLL